MRVFPLLPAVLLLITVPAFALKTIRHSHNAAHGKSQHASIKASTRGTTSHHTLHSVAAASAVHHEAPVSMPAERATAIQTALIQKGYLSGEPTGTWDAQTAAAMEKLQSDNGWQTRVTPDSRALIKLGLGPGASVETTPPQQP